MNKATIAAANYDAQWGAGTATDTAIDGSWQEFRIPGMEHIRDDEFRMKIKSVLIDWPTVELALTQAGIPRERAYQYVEQFSRRVSVQEIAHALAERMERIG